MSAYFNRGVLKGAIALLPKKDRTKLIFVVVLQILLSLLDLVGVAIVGAIGALAVT